MIRCQSLQGRCMIISWGRCMQCTYVETLQSPKIAGPVSGSWNNRQMAGISPLAG